MPRSYHSSAAKCPYYRGERADARAGGVLVSCQGCGDAEIIRLYFRSREKMMEHMERLCRDNWEACVVARIIQHEEEGPD